jgi:glycosyltransferase involved in cell wall biosynthesis
MNSLDVLLHPTYHESFSITLLEASMFGLPIITTDVGGNPEIIINNKTGLLVSPKDEISLFKAMEKLYKSKELRDTLGKNARKQYLDKFNFDDIVKKSYLKIYEK